MKERRDRASSADGTRKGSAPKKENARKHIFRGLIRCADALEQIVIFELKHLAIMLQQD